MGFAAQISAFALKANLRMDLVVRKITFDLYASIVARTPVDTGRARANYQIVTANNFGDGSTTEKVDKSGTMNLAVVAAALKDVKAGGVLRIVNNLPYIMRLEFGYSKQAPAGMARITVTEFQMKLNEVLGSL